MSPAKATTAIAGALIATLAMAPQASACSCAPGSEAEAFAGSDGAVVVRLVDRVSTQGSFQEKHVYRLVRVYKGPPSLARREALTLETSRDESACGLSDTKRRKGLYLYGRPGRWSSSLCSETAPRSMRNAAARVESKAVRPGPPCRA